MTLADAPLCPLDGSHTRGERLSCGFSPEMDLP